MKEKTLFIILLIILAAILLIGSLTGCNSSKNIASTSASVDSSIYHKYDSVINEINRLKITNDKLSKEASKSKVSFQKAPPCPEPVNTGAGCNYDTLVKAIKERDSYIASLRNTVTVYKDGSVKYQGQISTLTQQSQKTEQEASQIEITNERLLKQHSEDSTALIRAQSTFKKDVKHKNLWWLWLSIGLVAGYVIRWKQSSIINFLRPVIK